MRAEFLPDTFTFRCVESVVVDDISRVHPAGEAILLLPSTLHGPLQASSDIFNEGLIAVTSAFK